jgi:phosphate transport system permease protein
VTQAEQATHAVVSSPPSPRRIGQKRYEAAVRAVCFVCACVSILTTLAIVLTLTGQAGRFFTRVSPVAFFTGIEWSPAFSDPKFGVLPLVNGTLIIMIGSGLIALPLGLLSALYLSEYASPRARNILKPGLELLAGIPTVVYGFFGVVFVTPLLKTLFPNAGFGEFNGASGAIVVGIMILPLVSSLCEDALSAVPRALREGAYGLGATKMEVSLKIVVPAALSGITAAFILALSRAIGETMAVSLAAGMRPRMTLNPAESIQTMTAYIVQASKGDPPRESASYLSLFAVAATLFVITLLMNMLAARFVKKYRTVYD